MANSEDRVHVLLDRDAHKSAKIAAARSELSLKKWLSDLVRRETDAADSGEDE